MLSSSSFPKPPTSPPTFDAPVMPLKSSRAASAPPVQKGFSAVTGVVKSGFNTS
ncbi:hypothetical protein RchiOBHm_Chr2g0140771 [Rosa chinensis]|uniref:Uncharacterized protein n=1 Tax=Rosa chinensis TaxID=74649 RepID=A0A2P6RXI4_ROSCH|nr:hypothetical protein RchiOBHm_Chr2g0140771 [Rosa chinensis]